MKLGGRGEINTPGNDRLHSTVYLVQDISALYSQTRQHSNINAGTFFFFFFYEIFSLICKFIIPS